jgi:hypothetical protein
MAIDPELKRMIIAVLIALIAVLIVAGIVVTLTVRHFAP